MFALNKVYFHKTTEKKLITDLEKISKIFKKYFTKKNDWTYKEKWRIKHNKETNQKSDQFLAPDIEAKDRSLYLQWVEHIIRREYDILVKQVWKETPSGKELPDTQRRGGKIKYP